MKFGDDWSSIKKINSNSLIFCFGLNFPFEGFFVTVLGVSDPQLGSNAILTPKRHILQRNDVIWRRDRENRPTRLGGRRGEENTNKKRDGQTRYISPHSRGQTGRGRGVKICKGRGLHDVITRAKFYSYRSNGGWAVGGRQIAFPIGKPTRP